MGRFFIGDQVRVINGEHQGKEGVIDNISHHDGESDVYTIDVGGRWIKVTDFDVISA